MMYYTLDTNGLYANNVETFTSGGLVKDTHFNYFAADQPVSGKINEIVVQNAAEDYVYLYFPSAPTLADYRLSDYTTGVLGDLATLGAQEMSIWGEPNLYYVDLTTAGISNIDTMMLEWQGTTTAGGNWIVIDRVEYGWTAGTSPGPANTIHVDYSAGTGIADGTSAIRAVNGTDTDDSAADFTQNLPAVTPPPPEEPTELPASVTGLWCERDFGGGDIILHWDISVLATGYNVYATNDISVWDFVTPSATVGAVLTYTDAGVLIDGNHDYYIVKAFNLAGENDTNSNVAYVAECFYDYTAGGINKMWMSIPWGTDHIKTADELQLDLNRFDTGNPNTESVNKWDVINQGTVSWSYLSFLSMWSGTDFSIEPGVGVYCTMKIDFTWNYDPITP